MAEALDWESDGRDWPNREASSFVRAGGLRWHVQRMGAGPVLLLIHGTGSSTHSWRDLMPMLARDFSCVAIDLPGHAFTSTPASSQLSLRGMAQSVAALLGVLRLQPQAIVGHSAGAAIAAQMCLHEGTAPASIVSLNGAFLPLAGLPGLIFMPAARVMAATSLPSLLSAWGASDRVAVQRLIANTGSVLDARGVELYARLVGNPIHVAAALGMMAHWNLQPLMRRLPELEPSLHLLAASNDRTVPPEQSRQVKSLVGGARFTLLERLGHLAHEEKPAAVAALLLGRDRGHRAADPPCLGNAVRLG